MQASRYFAAAGLSALLLSMTAFSQGTAPARSCESLAKLALPDTTITMAQSVAVGEFKMPARGGGRDPDDGRWFRPAFLPQLAPFQRKNST
jgi:hypothetical protein